MPHAHGQLGCVRNQGLDRVPCVREMGALGKVGGEEEETERGREGEGGRESER
jgi:hypothetical protein